MQTFSTAYKTITYLYIIASCVALPTVSIHAATIVVTSENDSGPGTLREAIMNAANNDLIIFDSNVQTIKLTSPLPEIMTNITIDGLSLVIDSHIVANTCEALPSPVCNPEEFSAALRVTIDGEDIPPTAPFSGYGLRTSSNLTVRGLIIQNFSGSPEYPNAIGIGGTLGTSTINASCCEISNLINGPVQIDSDSTGITTTGDSIGINNAGAIEQCLIRNIRTAPVVNTAGTKFVIATGNAIGVNNFELVYKCNINNIHGGDIFANNTQLDYTFLLGQTIGCSFTIDIPVLPSGTIQSSTIHNIHGGSVCTNYSDSALIPVNSTATFDTILSFNTCGAYFNAPEKIITIDNTSICSVQTGAIQTCNDTVTIITPFAAGIFARGVETTITNNKLSHIDGNQLRVNGDNSNALISSAAGIISSARKTIATANTISHITAGTSCVDGECSRIMPQLLFTYLDDLQYFLPPASGLISLDDINTTAISTELKNNQISYIDGKSHTARGTNTSISSVGSVGAAAVLTDTSTIENNTIKTIIGSTLTASPTALIVRNMQESAGLQLLSKSIEAHNNHIDTVRETVIKTVGSTPAINAFIINPTEDNDRGVFSIFTSGIYADGLPFSITISGEPIVHITNNVISNICGSHTQSSGSKQGSIAAGIFMRRPRIRPEIASNAAPNISVQCPNGIIGTIESNIITKITGGTNAPGYGIFLNQDFYLTTLEAFSISTVLNNTISTIKGGVPTPYTLTKQEIIAECVSGSAGSTLFTILPLFPYGASTGINLFASGCTSVENNFIQNIVSPDKKARGIGMAASSDVDIAGNTIKTIAGPGIFVGGASANASLITQASLTPEQFEVLFPSVRNKITSNSTAADMTKGIELGVVNWNNFFISITPSNQSIQDIDGAVNVILTVVGNHNQVAANIAKVRCNSNGTTTIDITFSDKQHPNSTFIIQFFRNSTNLVPHGEQAISPFTTDFSFITDENGAARKRFVFVPAHKINKGDTISAHVTLTMDGTIGTNDSMTSPDLNDTSEFSVQRSEKNSKLTSLASCNTIPKEYPSFNNIVSSKTK